MRQQLACTLGACALLATAAVAVEHEVSQVSLEFVPPNVTVQPGDTIRWLWNNGSHTVTSGADCTADGIWFDMLFNISNPIVEWEVPNDIEPGVIPYHCMPHCAIFGMEGTITVEKGTECIGDVDGSLTVDFADLLLVLSNWGACP